MQLSNLLTDDDAVSPVIGVILMVAITVILAAVIGGVVTGLGQEKTSTTPTASFAFETVNNDSSGGSDEVRIIHDGGDNLNSKYIDVKVSGSGSAVEANKPSGTISAGDSWVGADGTDSTSVVRVIWNNPDSDSSTTLGTFER